MADAKNKQDILNERKAQKAEKRAKEQLKAKKAKAKHTVFAVCVIAILVLAAVLFAYKQVIVSGVIDRHTAVVSTENYSVSKSMMTYYFNSMYQNMASYGSSLGLDTSKSLKDQKFGESTWYDYILSQTTSQVSQLLILREGALAEGFELTDEDYAEIDEIIETIKSQAKQYNYPSVSSFVKTVYGSAVNLKDIRACMELSVFAEKYADKIIDEGQYTDADYDKYFKDNNETYNYIDYLEYSFDATKDSSTGKIDEAEAAQMKAHAEALAALTSVDEFNAYIKAYETTKQTSELDEDETLDMANVDAAVEKALIKHKAKGSLPSIIAKVFYEENAPVGTTTTESDDENGSYTVYMKASDKYFDDYVLRNAMTLFVSDSNHKDAEGAAAYADEIIAKWNESAKTEEAFEELAHEYDEGAHAHGANVVKNTSGAAYVEWLYSDERAAGDLDKIVSTGDKGVYIVLYTGENEMTAWEYDCDTALRNEHYSEKYSELAAEKWVYTNDDVKTLIPVSLSSK